MFRKLFTRTAVAAVLGAGAVLGAAAPAFAANPTTTSADIGAGSAGTRIGNSTFTRTLLANGLPLKAIAGRVGLTSSARLGAAFERRFGMAPSLFREMHRAA